MSGLSEVVERSFSATIIDQQSVTTHVDQLAFKPDYLNKDIVQPQMVYGWRGMAEITIPWANVQRIDLVVIDRRFNCLVTLRNRTRVPLRIDAANTEYSGTNEYGGILMIRAEYIRSIIFD